MGGLDSVRGLAELDVQEIKYLKLLLGLLEPLADFGTEHDFAPSPNASVSSPQTTTSMPNEIGRTLCD